MKVWPVVLMDRCKAIAVDGHSWSGLHWQWQLAVAVACEVDDPYIRTYHCSGLISRLETSSIIVNVVQAGIDAPYDVDDVATCTCGSAPTAPRATAEGVLIT